MGYITRFNLQKIISDFNTRVFFETGTWKGDAVDYALRFPFKKIISVEIVPGIAREAKERFAAEKKVEILEGSSGDMLTARLPGVDSNCIFWLDAHYPGADAGLKEYDAPEAEDLRLPLETEMTLIRSLHDRYDDVIIIDDLRVYEDGQFENGPAPTDTLPRKGRSLDFIDRYFSETHHFLRSSRDEGYLILFPKTRRQKPLINYLVT